MIQQLAVGLLVLGLLRAEPGTTTRSEPAGPALPGRRAVRMPAPPVTRPEAGAGELPSDSVWELVDTFRLHALIPAGQRLAVRFDAATEALRDTLLPDYLTETAKQAVALAPAWMQDDLWDNFRRLGRTIQDQYGQVIVDCPDKRYYDELCFQLAHLPGSAFNGLSPRLLIDNVQLAYEIDPQLQYVDIVDHGDPQHTSDYWSTTRYRTLDNGDTVWVEIPREVYYWWVIMPKLSDEPPLYVYDMFWREYLFYYADSGYPLLSEKLANTRLFWDGTTRSWGCPLDDSLPAVAVVGRWAAYTMPYGASGNRPIQPNQIAHEHNGNCGEMQDLMNAAARTALLPCGSVLDINEDHVWCEIWWDGAMQPYANDPTTHIKTGYVAYDRKYGGSKNCSGIWDWRNDGLQTSVIGSYSDVCTLTVDVRDSTLRPVDGAMVKLVSEDWYGGTAFCFFGTTDRFGRYSTALGDWQNYYLTIETPLGVVNAGRIIDSADAAPGAAFFYACTLAGRMDSLRMLADSAGGAEYRIDLVCEVGHETRYGLDCYNANGANQYAHVTEPGYIDAFICDEAQLQQYLAGAEFGAVDAVEDAASVNLSVTVPARDWYAVIANDEQLNLTEFADVTVRLYRQGAGVAERRAAGATRACLASSPCRGQALVRLSGAVRNVRIVDPAGRLVREFGAAEDGTEWDGCDPWGRDVKPGVYFCVVADAGMSVTIPLVWLGR